MITSELGQQKGVLPTLSNGGMRVEKGAIYQTGEKLGRTPPDGKKRVNFNEASISESETKVTNSAVNLLK